MTPARITLKFDARCKDCGAQLPAGTVARWYGRGRVYGIGCHPNPATEEGTHGMKETSPAPRRQLRQIARDIARNWERVNYAAAPYLRAMASLGEIDESIGHDSARSVVAYFLANAGGWRGEEARRIKAELRNLAK